jgi:cyclopropane fatty-acyl-phospholipid synthase-like methyltransferase
MNASEFDYTERPKQFGREEFWQQVRRTLNGKPIEEAQIQLIVDQIVGALELCPGDSVLDIGCGNGALSVRLEPHVGRLVGVDYSDYLIGVAREYFQSERVSFEIGRIEEMIGGQHYDGFDKALLYGVSSYLGDDLLESLVAWYFRTGGGTMFIGNVRDRTCAEEFYRRVPTPAELDDTTSSIGKWRQREWFESLAARYSLNIRFLKMPDAFYVSKYYYDVLFAKA